MADKPGMCYVCLYGFCLMSAGFVSVYGPVNCRCQGSGHYQGQSASVLKLAVPQPRSISPSHTTQPSPILPQVCLESQPVRILKRIPKSTRQLYLMEFCAIIDEVVQVATWECLLFHLLPLSTTPFWWWPQFVGY